MTAARDAPVGTRAVRARLPVSDIAVVLMSLVVAAAVVSGEQALADLSALLGVNLPA